MFRKWQGSNRNLLLIEVTSFPSQIPPQIIVVDWRGNWYKRYFYPIGTLLWKVSQILSLIVSWTLDWIVCCQEPSIKLWNRNYHFFGYVFLLSNFKFHLQKKLADCWQEDQDNCLLHYYYNTRATAPQLVTKPEDDGKKLSCQSMIPGSNMLPIKRSIDISVLCKS